MRHYELVLMINVDRSEQVQSMIEKYTSTIKGSGGQVHRFEDWGRRQLAYPIKKMYKAHYVLLNIECGADILKELEHTFRFNDSIIRYVILNCDKAIVEASPLMKPTYDPSARRPSPRRDPESTEDKPESKTEDAA